MTKPNVKARIETQYYVPSGLSLYFFLPNPSLNISSIELQKVINSLLDQIDWLEVALKLAKKWAPSVYCNIIKKILLVHIYWFIKIKDKGDGLSKFKNVQNDKKHIYVYKRNDEDKDDSRFLRNSEDGEDCIEDGDNNENIQINEDKS